MGISADISLLHLLPWKTIEKTHTVCSRLGVGYPKRWRKRGFRKTSASSRREFWRWPLLNGWTLNISQKIIKRYIFSYEFIEDTVTRAERNTALYTIILWSLKHFRKIPVCTETLQTTEKKKWKVHVCKSMFLPLLFCEIVFSLDPTYLISRTSN